MCLLRHDKGGQDGLERAAKSEWGTIGRSRRIDPRSSDALAEEPLGALAWKNWGTPSLWTLMRHKPHKPPLRYLLVPIHYDSHSLQVVGCVTRSGLLAPSAWPIALIVVVE